MSTLRCRLAADSQARKPNDGSRRNLTSYVCRSTSSWCAVSSECRRRRGRGRVPHLGSRKSSDFNPASLIHCCTASRVAGVISNGTGRWVSCCITVARDATWSPRQMSRTFRLTRSQPRSLLSMPKLKRASSRTRFSIQSRTRSAQMSLSLNGAFWPTKMRRHDGRVLVLGQPSLTVATGAEGQLCGRAEDSDSRPLRVPRSCQLGSDQQPTSRDFRSQTGQTCLADQRFTRRLVGGYRIYQAFTWPARLRGPNDGTVQPLDGAPASGQSQTLLCGVSCRGAVIKGAEQV